MPSCGRKGRMMKTPVFCLPLIVGLFFLGLSGQAFGQNYIEVLDKGTVDWTNGFIEASGVGEPPANPLNTAHSRAVAERNAHLAARANLIDVVKNVRVDSKTDVGDYLGGAGVNRDALDTLLRAARGVDVSYERNEEVKVTVSLKLWGALTELILPKGILTISTVKQPLEPEPKEESFTGLILDCRGISLQPALVPVIVDEEGDAVYGPAFASRDHAAEKGMVSYTRDFASAKNHPRVAPRPLAVKGLRAPKGRPCDIMISQADAAKIRQPPSNLGFLHQCRVLVVVD